MSSTETVGPAKPSLAQDWLYVLRYWLRGRRGLLILVAVVVVMGGALNWSWLVAAGIAPLLLTALPCVAMCGLGLCMNRMAGGSCSTSANGSENAGVPKPNAAQALAASPPVEGAPILPATRAGSAHPAPIIDAVEPAAVQQPHVQKERE